MSKMNQPIRTFGIGIYRGEFPSRNTYPNWVGVFQSRENSMDFLTNIHRCCSQVLPTTKEQIKPILFYPNDITPTRDAEPLRAWGYVWHGGKLYRIHAVKLVHMPGGGM